MFFLKKIIEYECKEYKQKIKELTLENNELKKMREVLIVKLEVIDDLQKELQKYKESLQDFANNCVLIIFKDLSSIVVPGDGYTNNGRLEVGWMLDSKSLASANFATPKTWEYIFVCKDEEEAQERLEEIQNKKELK